MLKFFRTSIVFRVTYNLTATCSLIEQTYLKIKVWYTTLDYNYAPKCMLCLLSVSPLPFNFVSLDVFEKMHTIQAR